MVFHGRGPVGGDQDAVHVCDRHHNPTRIRAGRHRGHDRRQLGRMSEPALPILGPGAGRAVGDQAGLQQLVDVPMDDHDFRRRLPARGRRARRPRVGQL